MLALPARMEPSAPTVLTSTLVNVQKVPFIFSVFMKHYSFR